MKRILVALDASPRGPDVLAAAIALAKRIDAKLVLMRAVAVPAEELPAEAYSVPLADLPGLLLKRAEISLTRFQELAADLIVDRRVVIGAPWQAICDTAHELDVDLIVVGAHGYGLIDRVLGTTAAKVVNNADRSVLVVRAPKRLS